MISKRIFASAFYLCALTLGALAAWADETPVKLHEVVVTATRTEKEPQDVTQTVTVITAEDIRESGASTAAEVLERTASIEINDQGAKGSLNTITIRGSSSQQVLVLLDGRRLNSASGGWYDLSTLPVPVQEIERIEIVRGPGSALYGADAVGGVVNIITKKPTAPESFVTAEGGNHNYQSLTVGNSNVIDKLYYSLTANKEKSDGFRTNSDEDKTLAGMKLGYQLNAGSSLELAADYLEKEIGVPGSITYPSPLAREWDRNAGTSLTYKTKLSQDLDIRVSAYDKRDKIIYLDPNPFFPQNSKQVSTSNGADAQMNLFAGHGNLVTFGIEGREDHIENNVAGEHTASVQSAYLQDEITIGEPLIIVIGGREDEHSVYGSKFSPKVSARYLFTSTGTIIRASAGEAYRAPTLNDLFWPFDGFEQGNPNLKPETSKEFEAGIEQPFGKGNTIKVSAFERKVKDLIQWQVDPNTFIYNPVNIGKAKITGYEAEGKFTLKQGLIWGLNLTYTDPIDETNGDRIYYTIPKTQFKTYVNIALQTKTNIYLENRTVTNYVKAGDPSWHYSVTDARISQTVMSGERFSAEVFAGIKNMFNRQYNVIYSNQGGFVTAYPMPRVEEYAGVTVRF